MTLITIIIRFVRGLILHISPMLMIRFYSRERIALRLLSSRGVWLSLGLCGARANHLKSKIYIAKIDDITRSNLLGITGFSAGAFPFIYLGIPICAPLILVLLWMTLLLISLLASKVLILCWEDWGYSICPPKGWSVFGCPLCQSLMASLIVSTTSVVLSSGIQIILLFLGHLCVILKEGLAWGS